MEPRHRYLDALRNFWNARSLASQSPPDRSGPSSAPKRRATRCWIRKGACCRHYCRKLSPPPRSGSWFRQSRKPCPGSAAWTIELPQASRQESSFAPLERCRPRAGAVRVRSRFRPGCSPRAHGGSRRSWLSWPMNRRRRCSASKRSRTDSIPGRQVAVLQELKSASRRGIQVVVSTHSPWLLDHVEVDDILHVERIAGDTVYSRFADRTGVNAYLGRVSSGAI